MKTENTLRTVRNSLLCFFTALGAGFLVACGGGGSPATSSPQEFRAYLFDSAVKGVEYSGPTGNGSTGNGGVFPASDGGMFEFSIGATTLGTVQVNSDWPYVTPADFDGVDEERVIAIARIMQGLDGNTPKDGISIPRSARVNLGAMNLLADARIVGASKTTGGFGLVADNATYPIPSVDVATGHFEATRNCLFSGGYVGSYSATAAVADLPLDGKSYFVFDPFGNQVRRLDVATGQTNAFALEMVDGVAPVGVQGSAISISSGTELSFVTPRMVTGTYADINNEGMTVESGTNSYTFVAGNPRATRRIAGFETDGADVVAMYVLDHFATGGDFRGQYYDVQNDEVFPLSLTIAMDGTWPNNEPTAMTSTLTLILSGTRGDGNATVSLQVIRNNDYYGKFEPVTGGGQTLSGTWCDISGSAGTAVPYPLPATPTTLSVVAQAGETPVSVTWSAVSGATSYKLYRSTVSSVGYAQIGDDEILVLVHGDTGLSVSTEYYYRLEACNFDGCSAPSSPVSVTTVPATPGALTVAAESSTQIDITWAAVPGATSYKLYQSTSSGGTYTQVGGDSDISAPPYMHTGLTPNTPYFYQLEACNSGGCSSRSPEGTATTESS